MALTKKVSYKGFDMEYWVIRGTAWDKFKNITFVDLIVYKDKAARDENIQNYLPLQEIQKSGQYKNLQNLGFPGNLTIPQLYEALNQSYMIDLLIEEARPAFMGADGEIVPEVPAVTKRVETNFFVDAVNS